MGQLDNRPENSGPTDPREMETLLRSMTHELRDIQQNLVVQLAQDMARLQVEQSRLTADMQRLQSQQQQLQSKQIQAAPGRPMVQQQQWTKQLAQVMASQLQSELSERFKQLAASPAPQSLSGAPPNPGLPPQQPPANNFNDNAYRLLASLDTTLNTTFKTLQQELSSYQSSLSQQLSRMHSLQQQGEVILETLVDRLIEQLQEEASNVQTTAEIVTGGRQGLPVGRIPTASADRQTGVAPPSTPSEPRDAERAAIAEPRPAPPATPAPTPAAEGNVFVTGLILALLSSITISFQNIITRVILSPQSLFGFWEGQILSPGAGNSLLILAMRMFLVVPLMGFVLAPILYPNTWRDIKQLGNPEKRGSLWIVVGSGLFLFMSQFFIYIALGNIPTGVAITLFFIFPPITAVLAWLIFGSRPTFIFALATLTIYIGCFLTVSAKLTQGASGNLVLGALTAIASGLTFAGYVILTQLSARKLKLHPAPFSVVNFSVILVFALIFVLLNIFPWNVAEENWGALWGGTLVLAATTLIGYALNNFAIPMIGPSLASVVAATGPGLTSLMALMFIGEQLGLNEWLGVMIVTVWVLGISVDNMNRQKQASKAPAK